MSETNLIQKLDFGQDSAESEEKFLQRVFLPTPFFKRVRNGQKQLILGRKGSGKTAICLRLYEMLSDQKAQVSLITPRNLDRFKMTMLEKGSVNLAESSLLAWKYTFYVELCIYILKAAQEKYTKNYAVWPDPYPQIRGFVTSNVEGATNWVDSTFKVFSRIRKVGLKIFEFELGDDPDSKDKNLTERLELITEPIKKALDDLFEDPIYLLVDKVDEVWEPGEESEALIIGLLRAAKELGEQNGLAKAIIFLRSDIFDVLRFHDSDKFRSMEERITWNKTDLNRLVALRARASTQMKVSRQAYDKVWHTFFPEKYDDVTSFETLLRYTLMRPRDLIQLCNLCRDHAQNNSHTKIQQKDIEDALPQYSEWKLKDLRDEYQVQFPFLQKIFLGVFYRTTPYLDRKEIAAGLNDPRVKEPLYQEFDSQYFEPLDTLLQLLYNIGFLGAVVKDETLYSFHDEKILTAYATGFEIHPAFRSALATKSIGGIRIGNVGGNIIGDRNIAGRDIAIGNIGGLNISTGGDIVHGNIQIRGDAELKANPEKKIDRVLEDWQQAIENEIQNLDDFEDDDKEYLRRTAAKGATLIRNFENAGLSKIAQNLNKMGAIAPSVIGLTTFILQDPLEEVGLLLERKNNRFTLTKREES